MQYLIQVYSYGTVEWDAMSPAEQEAVSEEYMAINDRPGIIGGAQLQPADTATTVRVQDGRTLTTDGPFAETKEVLGGYWLFESDDIDAAIELAALVPAARLGGAVEVRPLVER
jgi:hypothetical protein